MKDFFKNYKIPIILGTLAVIAVVATIIVLTEGFSSSSGLYIVTPSGSVTVTNSDVSENAVSGTVLKQGDTVTVGPSSSCVIAYKGKKNSENNYFIIGADTQILISDEFNGKNDGEIFLRNGTVIGNFAEEDRASVIVRTSDSAITLKNSVSKISYYTNEFISYTDLYTFMGNSEIQLYDPMRNPVNSPEVQIQKKWGRVVSEDDPSFEALNLDFDLNELTAFDLQQLLKIATLIGADFPYSIEEIRAALDAKGEELPADEPPAVSEPAVTSVTDMPSVTQETTAPVSPETAPPTETTLPGNTTVHVITTTAPTTTTTTAPTTTASQRPTTTTTASANNNTSTHIVTIVIDGEETIQEVPHGGNADRPADPVIDGYTFVGWDGSFENVTEDRTITAIFNSNGGSNTDEYHTVTIIIGNDITTKTVRHGQSADLPSYVEVPGYIFIGWDRDFTNITSDITITAILERSISTHTVTFVVEGNSYQMEVAHGDSVIPEYIPSYDSNGNRFIGWDKSLANITSDVTITAVFESDNYHMVTFLIDNEFYSVRVKDGERAEPPFWPVTDSNGTPFLFWDHDLNNITSDVTITAIYGSF